MKTIRINGVEQEIPPNPAGPTVFEEFISGLNQQLSQEHKVISCIRVDGHEISEAEENQLKTKPIEQLGNIELEISNPADLAYETLNTLEQYIDRLSSSIERAATHYKNRNFIAGDAYFVKSIDGLDLFVQTIGGVKLALRVGLHQKVALIEASLVSTMNDLLEAKRKNNYVFLAELLEKDLLVNLKEWKEQVFPIFRNLRTA